MKTWKQGIIGILAVIVLGFAVVACDDGKGKDTHTHEWEWKVTTPASYNADGLETETCKTCGVTNGTRPQSKPTPTEFNAQTMFTAYGEDYKADIIDRRIACGSTNIDELGFVEQFQRVIAAAYAAAGNAAKSRLENVFGGVANGKVTIYVDNPATFYKAKAPDSTTIYFHIDYLSSLSDTDLRTAITSIVTAMNPMNPTVPYEVE